MAEEETLRKEDALNQAHVSAEYWNAWVTKHKGWKVDFSHVDFTPGKQGPISFRGFNFPGEVNFQNATFGAGTSFSDTVFVGMADFTGAHFKSALDLNSTRFMQVPDLRFTKIDHHVSLANVQVEFAAKKVKFRKQAADPEDADRYRRLKELAVQARDHEQEQNFFADELRAARWHRTRGAALVPNYLYEWLSDFGRSVLRPSLCLVAVWLVFADVYMAMATNVRMAFSAAYLYSAAQLFPFIGSARDIKAWAGDKLYEQDAPALVYVHGLSLFEGFLGILFLFLIGLALRNRFRI